VILFIAAYRRDYAAAARYGLPLVALGAAVSIWHNYVERNPEAETGLCSIGGTTSCAVKWIEELGYVTIPVLSLSAFAAIALLLFGARALGRSESR
jgi:disulfide bond formation protein DsbB